VNERMMRSGSVLERLAVPALVMLGLLLGGCGDDEEGANPYVGLYAVEGHTLSSMGCDDPMELIDPGECFACVLGKPYFKIKEQSFFGQTLLTAIECDDVDTCDDDDDPDTIVLGGVLFDHAEGDAWVGEASGAAYGGASCSYTRVVYRIDASSAEVVEVTRVEHRNTPESASGMLMDDACRDLIDTPPAEGDLECREAESITARRVE